LLLIRVYQKAGATLRLGALILLVSLLAVLPQSLLQGYTDYSLLGLISRGLSPQAYSSFVVALGLVGIAMNPVLLFILMYVIGRTLDLGRNYAAVCYCLFLGALVGGVAGREVMYYASPAGTNALATAASIAFESAASAVSAVFVGFAAAALAFIRRLGPGGEIKQARPA
jgi:hypothetical protein